MSIRPIDMQVMIPKTQEVGKTHQAELQKPVSEQMQFEAQMQKQVNQNQHQVVHADKSDKTAIRDDQQRKKKEQDSKKKKKEETQAQKEGKKKAATTSIFDVKI